MQGIRINIIGEITKARDFDVDNLYIKYKFVLPKRHTGDLKKDKKNSWRHDFEDLKDTIEDRTSREELMQ